MKQATYPQNTVCVYALNWSKVTVNSYNIIYDLFQINAVLLNYLFIKKSWWEQLIKQNKTQNNTKNTKQNNFVH